MATRRAFNPDADETVQIAKPQRPAHSCIAHNCPMPGSILMGRDGICAWHYGRDSHDWPAVTRAIGDWQGIVDEIQLFRRSASAGSTGAYMARQFKEAVKRVEEAHGFDGWADLRPRANGETYPAWIYRLSQLLNEAVRRNLREV